MQETKQNQKDLAEAAQRHQNHIEWLKSLKNGQLLQINTSELCRFIKYIELTHPDLSFAFKMMKDGITKLKTIKHG